MQVEIVTSVENNSGFLTSHALQEFFTDGTDLAVHQQRSGQKESYLLLEPQDESFGRGKSPHVVQIVYTIEELKKVTIILALYFRQQADHKFVLVVPTVQTTDVLAEYDHAVTITRDSKSGITEITSTLDNAVKFSTQVRTIASTSVLTGEKR